MFQHLRATAVYNRLSEAPSLAGGRRQPIFPESPYSDSTAPQKAHNRPALPTARELVLTAGRRACLPHRGSRSLCVLVGPDTGPAASVPATERHPRDSGVASSGATRGKVTVVLHTGGDIDERVCSAVATPGKGNRLRVDRPAPVTGQKLESSHDRSSGFVAQNAAGARRRVGHDRSAGLSV